MSPVSFHLDGRNPFSPYQPSDSKIQTTTIERTTFNYLKVDKIAYDDLKDTINRFNKSKYKEKAYCLYGIAGSLFIVAIQSFICVCFGMEFYYHTLCGFVFFILTIICFILAIIISNKNKGTNRYNIEDVKDRIRTIDKSIYGEDFQDNNKETVSKQHPDVNGETGKL